jgi:putative aldouronate transport system substrate-binding protein
MRKSILLASVLLIAGLLFVFSGCGEKKAASSETKAAAEEFVSIDGYQFHSNPVTLSVVADWPSPFGTSWGEDMVSQWISKTTGVTMDIKWATTGNGEEMTLLLVSGDKLPDFFLTGGGSSNERNLIRNEYVAALDLLAEKHYPDFLKILPGGLFDIYKESDGHLYRTADWYNDVDDIIAYKSSHPDLASGTGDQAVFISKKAYEELGSPPLNTLAQFRDYLNRAKNAYPEAIPLVLYNMDLRNVKDAVNFFYRCYGGETYVYDPGDGTLKFCLRDPRYKSALKYLNQLYRDNVLTETNLFMDRNSVDTNLSRVNAIAYIGQGWEWYSKVQDGVAENSPLLPVAPPAGEGIAQQDIKLHTVDGQIGGNTSVLISADSENAARAIEYIAFAYTDTGKLYNRYGVKGVTWDYSPVDGLAKWTKEYKDYEAENGWTEMSKKYGPNNPVHSWFTSFNSALLESSEGARPIEVKGTPGYQKLFVNERIYDVSVIIDNDEMQMKFDQLMITVHENQMLCIMADSDARFEDAYRKYVSMAEGLNLASLENFYTGKYKSWLARGLKKP